MNKIEFDYSKLRGKIKEVYGNESDFAEAVGISSVSLSKKFNNRTGFSESEMLVACEKLGISIDETYPYFFNRKVKKT